jgi:hypothetical protein
MGPDCRYALIHTDDSRTVQISHSQLRDAPWDQSLIGRGVTFTIHSNYHGVAVAQHAVLVDP